MSEPPTPVYGGVLATARRMKAGRQPRRQQQPTSPPLSPGVEEEEREALQERLNEVQEEIRALKVRNRSWRSRYAELKNEISVKDGILLSMRRTVDRLKSALQSPFVPLSESDMASFIQKGMQLEKAIVEEAEVLALGDLKVSIDVPAGCTLCWKWLLQRNGPWGSHGPVTPWVFA